MAKYPVGSTVKVKWSPTKETYDAIVADIHEGQHLLIYGAKEGEISSEWANLASLPRRSVQIVKKVPKKKTIVGHQILINPDTVCSDDCKREKTAFVLSKTQERKIKCENCTDYKYGSVLYKVIYVSDCWVTNLPLDDIDFQVIEQTDD